ncbi:MAG: LysE family transporter [Firmicutes bacterium]|uniref:Lysine transporter LysE n=1 Tax=Sulfobacillus benefaciens TaxID=453960 RepID=A0A2T2WRW0_9FIRM|nr:LysE family transporter [Bacillota bacterium]MCL5015911.1 LysE family transporter [Bacillota bacterium]PSR24975.1 MAG: lysine transporter LysE [Sulfobacillus benefaciens]
MGLAFMHGFLLALALILPLGPQNSFVISQGATYRRYRHASPVVITAAVSDTTLIILAVLGVSVIVTALPLLKDILMALGAAFLLWMGWQSWHSPIDKVGSEDETMAYWTLKRRIMHSLRASLLNPHAIMDTVVVIGGGAALYPSLPEKMAYGSGAILVSWLWFLLISLAGRKLGRLRDQSRTLAWINRVSAAIMWSMAGNYLIQLSQSVSNLQF